MSRGRWFSRYDRARTSRPSSFDIDHLVPLHEVWKSGGWRWSSGTRERFANDLGYRPSLIAVTAHANRSKGDRQPQEWLPPRASFRCSYVSRWVAVKYRWHLDVDRAEKTYITGELRSCGWPSIARPGRAKISRRSASEGAQGGHGGGRARGGGSGGTDRRFHYCYQVIAAGHGPYYRGRDAKYSWYTDADNDGVVCES